MIPVIRDRSDRAVEGSRNDLILLSLGQLDKVYSITRNTNGKLRVKLRVLLCVKQQLAVKYVNVEVEAALCGITVKESDEVVLSLYIVLTESCGNYGEGIRDTVLGISEGKLRYGRKRCNGAVFVSAVHGVRAGSKRLTRKSSVGRRACVLTVGNV